MSAAYLISDLLPTDNDIPGIAYNNACDELNEI